MFDRLKDLKDKATDLASEHGEVIGQGLEKVASVIDDKTDGKYSDKLDTGVEKAKDFLGGLDDKDEKDAKDS
ncbi:antitoxin [Streptomyces paludis]|uniref:Antitoxin n=1 Tax=Streptomyces paludis TaxID=2282738 RepID=A0A345HX33_9ACTN|nr:antitoxin [Streptomyces paludis]AXG81257.1 antitoxin [Streptomyces paludis]